MGTEYNRWPYEELEVRASKDNNCFDFVTPWAKVKVEFESSFVGKVKSIVDKLQLEPDYKNINEFSWLMNQVERFPFSYILPRNPVNSNIIDISERKSLPDFVSSIGCDRLLEIINIDNDWEWDLESILAFSQSKNPKHYDPITLLTVCRRFHYLNFVEKDNSKQMYDYVLKFKNEDEKFKYCCATIIRQNHYVTERCIEVLKPALDISGKAKSKLQDFINSERGHDRILLKAINAMDHSPEQLNVVEVLGILMDVFKKAASNNFLAFVLIVDMFEGRSFEEKTFFAEYLIENGYDEAAKQLYIHKNINHEGNHDNIAIELLSDMETVDYNMAMDAMCYVELASIIINNLSGEILRILKKECEI